MKDDLKLYYTRGRIKGQGRGSIRVRHNVVVDVAVDVAVDVSLVDRWGARQKRMPRIRARCETRPLFHPEAHNIPQFRERSQTRWPTAKTSYRPTSTLFHAVRNN